MQVIHTSSNVQVIIIIIMLSGVNKTFALAIFLKDYTPEIHARKAESHAFFF